MENEWLELIVTAIVVYRCCHRHVPMCSVLACPLPHRPVQAVNLVCLNRGRPESTSNPPHRRRRRRRCRRRRRRGGLLARSRPRPRWPRITSYWPRAVAEDARCRGQRARAWFVLPACWLETPSHRCQALHERRLIVINSRSSSTVISDAN